MFLRLCVLLFLFVPCQAWTILPLLSDITTRDLSIELQNPVYKDGVLSTNQGGVIKGKDLYLQAKNISYIRLQEADKVVHKVEAEGALLFHFKGKVYIGSRLEFDLDNQTGEIYDVLTSSGQWFVGGKKLVLKPDGSGIIYDASMTTSENEHDDWSIQASEAYLSKTSTLSARNVRFLVLHSPVFWIPSFSADLKRGSTSPLKYDFKYFGKHGPRVGISYSFPMGQNWMTKVLLDISLTRGLGGGFEVEYKNPHSKERFSAFNYYAHDLATTDSTRKNRYRFQGKYTNHIFSDKVGVRGSYDKLSDQDVTGDYNNRGLDSSRTAPTELQFTRKEENWISSLNTKLRINNFQSVKQQLPLFQFSYRPYELGYTGIIVDNQFSAGYLDYRYAIQTPDVHNFRSARADVGQKVFRQFSTNNLSITPYVGYRVIGYGNSPEHDGKLLALAATGVECHTRFIRTTPGFRHALEPYVQYDYTTAPTVKPPRHFLFDLQDGLYRFNSTRYGTRNFMRFQKEGGFDSHLNMDLYGRTFFQTPTIGSATPRVYLDSSWKATAYSSFFLKTAWDTQRNNFDHFNLRTEYTLSENAAIALEYRRRNAFSWRKVDPENFMLDTFRSQNSLRHSQLSDRRDTLLPHFYLRLSPNLAVEVLSRHGWGRQHARAYNEYEFNIITLVRGVLRLTLNFQHRESENRYAVYCSFGAKPPGTFTGIKKLGQGDYDMP